MFCLWWLSMVTIIILIANAGLNRSQRTSNGEMDGLEARGRTRYRSCRRGASTGCWSARDSTWRPVGPRSARPLDSLRRRWGQRRGPLSSLPLFLSLYFSWFLTRDAPARLSIPSESRRNTGRSASLPPAHLVRTTSVFGEYFLLRFFLNRIFGRNFLKLQICARILRKDYL